MTTLHFSVSSRRRERSRNGPRPLLLIGAVCLLAYADRDSVLPVEPASGVLGTSSCALGVTEVAARLTIATLVGSIGALERTGELTSGHPTALRGHLADVLCRTDTGNYRVAIAQLRSA